MKKVIILFSLFLLSFISIAQEGIITDEVKNHIKARIDSELNVGIVLGFVDGDKVEFFSYGQTSLENGSEVDEHSVFEIGSISKTFTTTMMAEEVLRGKMSLSDPISKYLPKNVKVPTRNDRQITLKDLATHSSGLPRMPSNFEPEDQSNPYVDYTIDLAYEFMSSVELTRDIGELYEYSNYAMGMLGHILELQNNMSYNDLLVERIANVLGMDNTRVDFTDNMMKHLAKGHDNGKEVSNWDLPALAGAGAIRSTASDMVKYIQANLSNKNTALIKAMKFTHNEAYTDDAQGIEMGLAWHLANQGSLLAHNGGTGGYRAFTAFNPRTNQGVIVMTNSTESVDGIGLKLLDPSHELVIPKKSIASFLAKEIESSGVESAIATYRKIKSENDTSYNLEERELNNLGYSLLNNKNINAALAIFKLNVEMFPEASNPYDSLGEVYLKNGDSALAITNYKKSLQLNKGNDNAKEVLQKLGVMETGVIDDFKVTPEVLDTYVGKYELAPTFIITVTRKDSQLYLQATGQPQFEVYPSAINEFYLKVVEARVIFNADDLGKITSMTLHQGGQVIPGKKIE